MVGFGFTNDFRQAKRIGSDIKRYLQVSERASVLAVKGETDRLKNRLRDDVKKAGLGRRVANTWRAKTYPERGRASMDAAGFLWSKAPKIIESFDKGAVIRSKNGRYLAIATENVPRRGGFRGARLTPDKWPERLGKLQVVKAKSGNLLLVAQRQSSYTREGSFKGFRAPSQRSLRTGNRLTSVVMFILVPQVRMKKRFDVARRVSESASRLPDRLYNEKMRLLR